MRHKFIVYETEFPKKMVFDMLLVENPSDVMTVVRKIIGPKCTDIALNPHALWDSRIVGKVVIPCHTQHLYNPVTLGNEVFHTMMGLIKTEKLIVNKNGGYQTLKEDMNFLGWKEIKREERDT